MTNKGPRKGPGRDSLPIPRGLRIAIFGEIVYDSAEEAMA